MYYISFDNILHGDSQVKTVLEMFRVYCTAAGFTSLWFPAVVSLVNC